MAGPQVLRSRAMQAAIVAEVRTLLAVEGAPVALRTLLEIARDTTAPKGVRVDASKALLDRAGFVAPRSKPGEDGAKTLQEMSIDELRAFIDKAESERAAAARDVSPGTDNAPDDAPIPGELSDLLE